MDELVQIYVPKKHLSRVYGFIAELDGSTDNSEIVEKPRDWTPELVTRAFKESPGSMRRMLAEMARRPDEELSTADLAAAMRDGADWNNVAGALGAFGRRIRNRYKVTEPPYEAGWDEDGKSYYRMSESVAAVIRELPIRGTRRG